MASVEREDMLKASASEIRAEIEQLKLDMQKIHGTHSHTTSGQHLAEA